MAVKSTFISKKVRTSNIAKELLLIAREYEISIHDLDFNLTETELYIKKTSSKDKEKKQDEFHQVLESEFNDLQNIDTLGDIELSIKQIYDVEIFLLKEPIFPNLTVIITTNKTLSEVYATIKEGSSLQPMENIFKNLKKYFNKRKLRTNLLIDIWDTQMLVQLKKISAKIEVNEGIEFKEDLSILISKALVPTQTQQDALIVHFNDKLKAKDDYGRINYKKRGFIISVQEGELLITYRKSFIGTAGRNCRGEFLKVADIEDKHYPTFNVDSNCIETKEDNDKIEYFAMKNGYMDIDSSMYYIKEELEVEEISFRSTGDIKAGLDKDVVIRVKKSDSLDDAIGMGVAVEAKEIIIEGNIGSDSTITAKLIEIQGQTHKTSQVNADKIFIDLHKGFAKGKEIEIRRLEQGEVRGETISIQQAAGGEIIGKSIIIDVLQSHAKIIASKSIIIKKMKGCENFFYINQTQVGNNAKKLDVLNTDIDAKRIEINVSKKALDEEKMLLKKHQPVIKEIKEKLLSYKKSKIQLPKAFVAKYKEFQLLENKIKNHEKDYYLMLEMFEIMTKRHKKFQADVLHAKIINYDSWKGHNVVTFHLTFPEQELVFIPPEGLSKSVITLKYDKDSDEYSVVSESISGVKDVENR